MKRTLLYIISALAVLAFGFGTALADNGGGNGGKPKGGDNSCPPSSHEVRDAAGNVIGCEHNGDGGGNCGQNQSGKGDKEGNGGDKGYGNKDGCQGEGTPPPPPPPPPPCKVNCGPPPPPCTVNCSPPPPPPCKVNCGAPPPCTVNCGGDTTTTQTTTTQTTTPTPPVVPPAVTPPKAKPHAAKPPKAKAPRASVTKTKLETALRKQAKPDTTPSSEPQATGVLPRTGLPLFPLALLGGGLTGLGGWMRRRFPR